MALASFEFCCFVGSWTGSGSDCFFSHAKGLGDLYFLLKNRDYLDPLHTDDEKFGSRKGPRVMQSLI